MEKYFVEIKIIEKEGKFKPEISIVKENNDGQEYQEIILDKDVIFNTEEEAKRVASLVGKEELIEKYGNVEVGIRFL